MMFTVVITPSVFQLHIEQVIKEVAKLRNTGTLCGRNLYG